MSVVGRKAVLFRGWRYTKGFYKLKQQERVKESCHVAI